MSFTRVNPGGWVTNDPFTPAQANALDINVSRAGDLTNGGSYSLASALILNGAGGTQFGADGGVGITSARRTGPLTLATATATTAQRIDTTTLGAANATIDVSKDVWVNTTAVTSSFTFTLRSTTSPVPAAGQSIKFAGKTGVGGAIVIAREGAVTLVASSGSSVYLACECMFDGTVWRLISASGGITVNLTNSP